MCFPYGFANILFGVLLSWRQNNQSQIKCLKEGVNYTIKTASTALQLSENSTAVELLSTSPLLYWNRVSLC